MKRQKVNPKTWPFRQDDPRWGDDLMWDRKQVMDVDPRAGASLSRHKKGNTIGHEGCMLTCLSMVLKLLGEKSTHRNPGKLNGFAQQELFYTTRGLSMVPLYADLLVDATHGEVQMFLKEEYLSGERGWPRNRARDCVPLLAYRALPRANRDDIVLMLKTGTWDDSFASHYVLVDSEAPGAWDEDDVPILDPVQPLNSKKWPWRLSDSAAHLCGDPRIKKEWRKAKIGDLQICGVWAFARWTKRSDRMLGAALLEGISTTLSSRHS